MGMFDFVSDAVSEAQDRAQETASNAADLSSSVWEDMKSAASNAPTGAGGEVDIPNPIRGADQTIRRAGKDLGHGAEVVRTAAEQIYSQLENLPGLTLGGGADVEVNGEKKRVELPNLEINNPLRDMREGAESVFGQLKGRADEAGGKVRNEVEKQVSNLEGIPDLTLGAGGDVEVNGEKHRVDLPDLHFRNPVRAARKNAEQTQEEAESKREQAEREYTRLYNLPGLTVSGEADGQTSENRADLDFSLGLDPFYGTKPGVGIHFNR